MSGYLRTSQIKAAACSLGLLRPCSQRSRVRGFTPSLKAKTWRDMWLNEGFATYAEWLWQEDHGGDTTDEIFKALYRGDYYDDPEENRAIWAFPPARPDKAAHLSDSPVYDRGAMVLHKIRQKVGDDTFYDIVQGWAAAQAQSSPMSPISRGPSSISRLP